MPPDVADSGKLRQQPVVLLFVPEFGRANRRMNFEHTAYARGSGETHM